MKKYFKVKVKGSGPKSLLLSFGLLRLNFKVFFYKSNNNNYSINDKLFLISYSSKKLLSELKIWKKLEPYCQKIDSLYIFNNQYSKKYGHSSIDSDNYTNQKENLFWFVNYSDFSKILLNELNTFKNFNICSTNNLLDSENYDYTFLYNNLDLKDELLGNVSSINNNYKNSIIFFKVYLRGAKEKRIYEINRDQGNILLIPLGNNIYQIIWNTKYSNLNFSILSNNSFFLDNLSVLLPSNLKCDQIIGLINSYPILENCKYEKEYSNGVNLNEQFVQSIYNTGFYDFDLCLVEVNNILKCFNSSGLNYYLYLYKILKSYYFNNLFMIYKSLSFYSIFFPRKRTILQRLVK
tara:strand:- start:1963 stop:3012 length:1050 start_codon:yes stop_codon:yes gene_type:complete